MIQEMHLPSVRSVSGYSGWHDFWEDLEQQECPWCRQTSGTEKATFEATVELMIRASVPHGQMTSLQELWAKLPFRHVSFKEISWNAFCKLDLYIPGGHVEAWDGFLQILTMDDTDERDLAKEEAVKPGLTQFLKALSDCAHVTNQKMMPEIWEYAAALPYDVKRLLCEHLYTMAMMELLCQAIG